MHVASDEIISAPALYTTATATYVSFKGNGAVCTGGTSGDLATLKIVPGSPPTLAGSWCATTGSGSPMVTTTDGTSDAIVWSMGAESDDLLHGFDGDTGAVVFNGGGFKIPQHAALQHAHRGQGADLRGGGQHGGGVQALRRRARGAHPRPASSASSASRRW